MLTVIWFIIIRHSLNLFTQAKLLSLLILSEWIYSKFFSEYIYKYLSHTCISLTFALSEKKYTVKNVFTFFWHKDIKLKKKKKK